MNRGTGIAILVIVTFGVGFLVGHFSNLGAPPSTAPAPPPVPGPQAAPEAPKAPQAPQAAKPAPTPAPAPKAVPAVPSLPPLAGNILVDGGFESAFPGGPDQHGNPFNDWGGWKWEGNCERLADFNIKHSGKSSALYIGHDACMIANIQKLELTPGSYKLTGYARAAGLNGGKFGQGMNIALEGQALGEKPYGLPMGTYGWTKFEIVWNVPAAETANLYTYMYGIGRFWLDDLSLVKLAAPEKEGLTVAPQPEEKLFEYSGADAVKCLSCGKDIAPDADVCAVCGSSQKALQEAARKAAEEKRIADERRRAAAEAAAKLPERLIRDGGFEKMYDRPDPNGNAFEEWGGWLAEGKATRGADTQVKHSGKASAVLTGTNPCHIWHGQELVTEAGWYKLTGYIRSDAKPGKWGQTAVVAFEADDKTLGSDQLPSGTYNWRKFERIYHFDQKYSPNRLYLYMYGDGKVWFDDLTMEKLEGENLKEGLTLSNPEPAGDAAAPPPAATAVGDASAWPAAQPYPPVGSIHLWQYTPPADPNQEPFDYGLYITPPWPDGGQLRINFPEHLEYNPGSRGILRYSDKNPKGHWVVAADGMSARLDVESVTAPGVFVKGQATVVAKDRVEVVMEIINRTQFPLGSVFPLYCFHYQPLKGFPQWKDNFAHTLILKDGRVVALANVPTEKADTTRKAAPVRGCPQRDLGLAAKMGGLIPGEVDAALIAVTALEGPHKLVLGWTPGKNVFSNSAIPCVHADPYYGTIAPGASASGKAVILLTDEPLEKTMKGLAEEGVGAYHSTTGSAALP